MMKDPGMRDERARGQNCQQCRPKGSPQRAAHPLRAIRAYGWPHRAESRRIVLHPNSHPRTPPPPSRSTGGMRVQAARAKTTAPIPT